MGGETVLFAFGWEARQVYLPAGVAPTGEIEPSAACLTQHALPRLLLVAWALPATACSGIQSSLSPSGREAARVVELFWWMTIVAVLVWIGVIALALYYTRTAAG